jgi:hypothetical protein
MAKRTWNKQAAKDRINARLNLEVILEGPAVKVG